MKVVCAWCKEDMGEKPPLDNTDITHGMCKSCYQLELRKWRRLRKIRGGKYANQQASTDIR